MKKTDYGREALENALPVKQGIRMSNPTKRQHTVPRLYLKNFASDGKGLFCFDKREGRSFPKGVKEATVEEWFYESNGLKTNAVENHLSAKEAAYAKVLRETLSIANSLLILKTLPTPFFPPDVRRLWAEFLLLQLFRTPAHRQIFVKRHRQILEENPSMNAILKDDSPEDAHAEWLVKSDSYSDLIHYWMTFEFGLWRCPAGERLRMSDHPVLVSFEGENNGLGAGNPYVFLPLSPKWLLAAMPVGSHEWPGSFFAMTPEWVSMFNDWQTANATRFVFANDRDFSDVEALIAQQPRLRDGHVEIRRRPPAGSAPIVIIGGR